MSGRDTKRRLEGGASEPSSVGPGCQGPGVSPGVFSSSADAACGAGGDEETRTPDPLLAKEMLCQLSYVPAEAKMVGVSGLEPETSALSGQCSNQLS